MAITIPTNSWRNLTTNLFPLKIFYELSRPDLFITSLQAIKWTWLTGHNPVISEIITSEANYRCNIEARSLNIKMIKLIRVHSS